MATQPQFYLDKILEVSTSERPPVLDYVGGVNEMVAGGATQYEGAGVLEASALIDGAGLGTLQSAGALSALSAIAGAGLVPKQGAGNLKAQTTISGTGLAAKEGSATLQAQTVISGAGLAAEQGAGALQAQTAISGAGLAASQGTGKLQAEAQTAGSGLSGHESTGNLTAQFASAGATLTARAATGNLLTLIGTDGAAQSIRNANGVLDALALLRGDGVFIEGAEPPLFEVVPSKRVVIFQGWGAEGVPLAHFQAAKSAVRCNVACIFGDYDNGGLALSIARARGLELEVVVQSSPFCLVASDQEQPDVEDLATACAAWKEAGVAAVILVHESPGCNNPCATTYLTAAKAACQAAGLYGIGIVDDPTSGNQSIPRSVGLSIWVEVRGEIWTTQQGGWVWGETAESISTHVRGRITKLEDTETPGEWDLILWQIGGIDPAEWEGLTEAQKDWAWRVLAQWQLDVMLDELAPTSRGALALWIEETFTDGQAREWIGLEGQPSYAAQLAAWWARMMSASLEYRLRISAGLDLLALSASLEQRPAMTASLELSAPSATLAHASITATLALEGPTGGA